MDAFGPTCSKSDIPRTEKRGLELAEDFYEAGDDSTERAL